MDQIGCLEPCIWNFDVETPYNLVLLKIDSRCEDNTNLYCREVACEDENCVSGLCRMADPWVVSIEPSMSYYQGVNSLVSVLYVQWNHHLMCCHKSVCIFNYAHFLETLWNSEDLCVYSANLFLSSLFFQSSTISLSCQLGLLTRTKSVECYTKWINIQSNNSILLYLTVTSHLYKVFVVLVFTSVFLQIKY